MKGFFMKYAGKIGQMAPVFLRTEADDVPTHPVKREEVSSSMGLKCLVYNHKNTERKVDFAAENLENRKIRINTHIILNVLYRGCMGGRSFFQGVYHPFLYSYRTRVQPRQCRCDMSMEDLLNEELRMKNDE